MHTVAPGVELPAVPVARTAGARLRIAMVAACPFPYPRGTPVRIYRMAEALGRRGHDVHVVTYHLGESAAAAPFTVHRTPHLRSYRRYAPGPSYQKLLLLDPLLHRVLRRVLAQQRFDLIHAHHYEGLLVAQPLGRRHRTPVIYDAHTLLSSELPFYDLGLGRRIKQSLGHELDRRLPGRATHVIAVTEALRNRLVAIGAVPAARASVVHNGVEVELFGVPPAGRDGSTRNIVFSGNLASYQGVEFLLRAFREVASRRADVRLQLLTQSPFGGYEALARTLGIRDRIDVLDVPFDEVPARLRAADVAVNPRTDCEGVPQKLVNYMAAGCPIVSFEGSAVHLQHGVSGWIVANADTGAMADGIVRLLDDVALAHRLGAAARTHITDEYSWEQVARRVEDVYEHVLGAGTRRA